ncbi:phage head closure protein [Paracoccus litorisediminis]|uniref:Phage head closure protein n=1 Tax=Paracoccus litorisediminis TaxID=2006130 RepID=A0A844HNG0_9RHOB|nr:phage head closure protein [Paracoccus litorisediminis]MTH61440.1 phage head closure protein [Paracoccus litorisediminis]
MTTIGELNRRATFLRPIKDRDADGKVIQSYIPVFEAWANVRWLRGGESVMQSRLASRSPAIVTIRAHVAAREVTSEWRVQIEGRAFEIKEDPRESDDRAFLELLVERIA